MGQGPSSFSIICAQQIPGLCGDCKRTVALALNPKPSEGFEVHVQVSQLPGVKGVVVQFLNRAWHGPQF